MCILSGCDYLDSLPGIGLGKASKLFKTVDLFKDIDHVSNNSSLQWRRVTKNMEVAQIKKI